MAESVSFDLRNVVNRVVNQSEGASTGTNSADVGSQIEALKKKLISLQKDFKEAVSEQSKEGQAKAKLIQMQIQVTQARMEQLIAQQAQQAQRALESNKTGKQGASADTQISHVKKAVDPVLGGNVDAFV
ncbi:FlxA-like family protein [Undibacterium sp. Ji49W]|uniref:FlxA-like family protein n=1 Tax=Undibacterium sp. Ji49W TaxID=3413040 RepID=UPI003BF3AB51